MRNRTQQLIVVVMLLVFFAASAFSGAPRLVNYQGRVLTSTGAPVANGPHTFDFAIYDAPVGGILQWSELGVVIVTTNALFTYALGSTTGFPVLMFTDNEELWLEVVVDGQLQAPRTRLISNPYAETAANLSMDSWWGVGYAWKTDVNVHQFSTFGGDGQEQIRLWGGGWGELILHDFDPTNDETVYLTANTSSGGELQLRDDNGVTTIDLHGGLPGNSSAQLPADAIYDVEILDEPGVANQVRSSTFFTPVAGDQKVDSVTITLPTSGYVEVTAGCYLNMQHTTGTTSQIYVGIAKVGSIDFSDPGAQVCSVPSSSASANYQIPCTSTRLYSESAGAQKYYLNVDRISGANAVLNLAQIYIRAKFYPTAYGPIVLASSDNDPNPPRLTNAPSDGSISFENLTLKVHTLEELNAKLAEEADVLRADNERLRTERRANSEELQKVSPK